MYCTMELTVVDAVWLIILCYYCICSGELKGEIPIYRWRGRGYIFRYRIAFSFLHVNFPTQISMSMIWQVPCSDGNLATKFFKICMLWTKLHSQFLVNFPYKSKFPWPFLTVCSGEHSSLNQIKHRCTLVFYYALSKYYSRKYCQITLQYLLLYTVWIYSKPSATV
jgi:hypothetical protein